MFLYSRRRPYSDNTEKNMTYIHCVNSKSTSLVQQSGDSYVGTKSETKRKGGIGSI